MNNEQLITLEWKTEQRGAVKTAFYRPANLTVVVKSAKISSTNKAFWEVLQRGTSKGWDYKDTMADCQAEAIKWIETRAAYTLWDNEWLASKITPYLQGYPLALLEYGWQEKLGAYCNSPSKVVAHHPAIEAHKAWLKEEWGRLSYIEARALNALTFATDETTKQLVLQILGREVE